MDCIIFATGFEVGTDYTRRAGYDVVGKDGLKLSDKWADGMRTLHGLHTRGFPNMFVISNSQAGFTTNFPHSMDNTARHIGYILNRCAEEQDSCHRTLASSRGCLGRGDHFGGAVCRAISIRLHAWLLQQRGSTESEERPKWSVWQGLKSVLCKNAGLARR